MHVCKFEILITLIYVSRFENRGHFSLFVDFEFNFVVLGRSTVDEHFVAL